MNNLLTKKTNTVDRVKVDIGRHIPARMVIVCLFFCFVCFHSLSLPLHATEPELPADSVFKLETFEDETGTHRYAIYVPQQYSEDKKWPVVLFLHGAGERGTDGVKPTRIGLGAAIQDNPDGYPFIAVFPQVEDHDRRYLAGWQASSSDGMRAIHILDQVIQRYSVDPKRQIVTGWSMGGYGAWNLAAANPERWSAVLPMSGGGEAKWAKQLQNTPIWNFHGTEDFVVLPEESEKMAQAFGEQESHRAHFTQVRAAAHDVWRHVYGNLQVVHWMLNPKPENIVDMTKAKAVVEELPAPFIPALELKKAAIVRVGNEALDAFSYAISNQVPTDLLGGALDNIHTTTNTDGYSFNVVFSNISYQADLDRIKLHTTEGNVLAIQLGFKQIRLNLGHTSVRGRHRSATAGPIALLLGTREPIWLELRVEPFIENGRIRLRNKGSRFSLDRNNMSVSRPAGVQVRGLGMTRSRVSNGLVSGLYDSRSRIEQEIQQVAPTIVTKLEENLDLSDILQSSSSIWPLPVYPPRIRVRPASMSVDEKGFSLGLDFIIAAFDESMAPDQPKVMEPLRELNVHKTSQLEIVLAANTLTEAMRVFIGEGVAKLDVLDIPGSTFDRWASLEQWKKIIPDLADMKPEADIRAQLSLNQPLVVSEKVTVVPADAQPEGKGNVLSSSQSLFRLPEVRLTLSKAMLENGKRTWEQIGILKYEIEQEFILSFAKPQHTKREIQLSFSNEMQLGVSHHSDKENSNRKINSELAKKMFVASLGGWLNKSIEQSMLIPDLNFGAAGLRASGLVLEQGQLRVGFETPTVRFVNKTDQTQRYQTKGPNSSWSQFWELAAGQTHQFKVPYLMLYQRNVGGVNEMYTLPIGADLEFRQDDSIETGTTVARLYQVDSRSKPKRPTKAERLTE